jgi:hypothetical protein
MGELSLSWEIHTRLVKVIGPWQYPYGTEIELQGTILNAVLEFVEAPQRLCSHGSKGERQNSRQIPNTGP